MKLLVLGGTGVISREIVNQALAAGHEVSVFNRGSRKLPFAGDVETIVGDRLKRDEFEKSMQARRFDVVIDMICFDAEDARSTLRAFTGQCGHLIVTSSVAAYKRPYRSVPTVESAEELWDDPAFAYAFNKAEMERVLRPALKDPGLPLTLLRPSLTYGPGAANIGVLRQNVGIVDRIRRGKPLVMFGDGTTPWSFTFVPDLARAFLGLAGNPRAFGEDFHACSEERCVWEDLYLEFGRLLGKTPNIVHIPADLLRKAAPNLCAHLYYEKSYSGLFDNAKLRTAIPGFRAEITLHEGLKTILAGYEAEKPAMDPEKNSLEDCLVQLYTGYASRMNGLYTR